MQHRFFAQSSRTLRRARGFTLVELMVALSGGLFLSVVVFALARDASRFYQREGRMTTATLAGMIGFERLKSDIERAGYLSTPNIQRDPFLATSVDSGTPAGLFSLAALRITPDTPNLSGNASFALNATAGQTLTPDQLVLSGSYSATDEFPIAEASTGQTIYLQKDTAPMARLGYIGASTSAQLVLLQNVFGAAPGQILRVKDPAGRLYFGQISSVAAGDQPSVTLLAPLPVRSSGVGATGLSGFAVGSSANVVNIVRYRVMDLQNSTQGAAWKPLFDASKGAPGESARTELVRDQLDSTGTPIAGTTDVVAEYAVDLSFSVLGQLNPGTNSATAPLLTQATAGTTAFAQYYAANSQGDFPELVRSVHVRLSVRSREADRAGIIPGGFYRFQVDANSAARVRTFQADVALLNQTGVQW